MFPVESLPPVKVGKEGLEKKGYKWNWLRQLGDHAHPNYDELIPRARANYFGMLRLIDDQIKRFAEFLKKAGKLENTLLIFLSDHGDYTGEYGLMRKGAEMPEILMRIPMLFTGPGVKASSKPNTEFVSIVDVMPTICEALDIPLPAGVQGRSLWPLLTGQEYPEKEFKTVYGELGYGGLHFTDEDNIDFEDTCNKFENGKSFDELNGCTQSGSMRMLRKGDWKLLFDMMGDGQLYNLKNDPMEMENLYTADEYKEIKTELLEELLAWTMKVQDTLPQTRGKYRLRKDPRNYWTPYKR
jgi:arylsulfatase A-like enzyme